MDIVTSVPMNRARYREVDAKMRRATRRLPGCSDCTNIAPHPIDGATSGADHGVSKYAGMTAAVGQTLSIPLFANAQKMKEAPVLLRRAATISGLLGLIITEKPRDQWYSVLADMTSQRVAQNTRAFAAKLMIQESEAFTTALLFSMLQGALGAAVGIEDDVVLGYRKAMASLDTALAAIAKDDVDRSKLNGIGALGWSVTDTIADWIKENIGTALDWVISALGKLGRQVSEYLCKGMKALFTGSLEPVGGVMCTIIQLTLGGAIDSIRAGAAILKALFLGLSKFFAALFSAKWKDAALALVEMVNIIVVVILGGTFSSFLGIPMVDAELTPQQKADGLVSLEGLGRQLPVSFTVTLIASVLGVLISGPNPVTISALLVTLAPAVSVIVVPALSRTSKFRGVDLNILKAGVEAIVKIGALVVATVMSMGDVIQRFGDALDRYWKKLKKDPGGELTKLMSSFTATFTARWNEFMAKIVTGSLKGIGSGIMAFLSFLPDVLIAMGDPDLTSAVQAGKQLVETTLTTIEQAKTLWERAIKDAATDIRVAKLMREHIDEARPTLDSICVNHPNDPAFKAYCDFPKEVGTEKIVTVEKIVYRDQPATPGSGSSPVAPKKPGTTTITVETRTPKKSGISGTMIFAGTAAAVLAVIALGKGA